LSQQPVPGTSPPESEGGAGRSRVPYLALHPMGFSVPPRLRLERWALTPPFHPYPALLRERGGIFSVALSVWTPHGIAARVYLTANRLSAASASYEASRPMVFGLSSPVPLFLQPFSQIGFSICRRTQIRPNLVSERAGQKRFSALPKS